MGRFAKFLGEVNIKIDGEDLNLGKLSVDDVQKIVDLSKIKENEIVSGVRVITNILCKNMPEEPREEVESFVLKNYSDITQEIVIALGWTTREKLDAEVSKALDSKKKDD